MTRRRVSLTVLALAVLFVAGPADARPKRIHPERWYQERWCGERGGVMEYRLPDRTRIDCVFDGVAVEMDFADEYREAIGQALHYAREACNDPALGCLRPGIVLIIERPSDERYLEKLRDALERADCGDVQVWAEKSP